MPPAAWMQLSKTLRATVLARSDCAACSFRSPPGGDAVTADVVDANSESNAFDRGFVGRHLVGGEPVINTLQERLALGLQELLEVRQRLAVDIQIHGTPFEP